MNGGRHGEMMLGRLLAVDWTGGTSFDHARSRARLMREYLRRSAWWAQTLDAVAEWPFFDIAAHLAPEVHVPEGIARHLEDLISTRIGWPSVAGACRAALHWAALTDARIPTAYELDDPYEPLVLLFERGGGFTTEHGYIDLGGSSIPRGTWQDHLVAEPVVDLTQSTLDALDLG
jgi:hypothetical protein